MAAGLLLAEYLLLTVRYDIAQFRPRFQFIGSAGALAPLVFLSLTAVVALWRSPGTAALARLAATADRPARRLGWLAVHGAVALVFLAVSHHLLGRPPGGPHEGAWLAGWLTTVALLVASAAAYAFPAAALGPLGALVGRPAIAGVVVGFAAWCAGYAAQGVWPWLARLTLGVTAATLDPLAGDRLTVQIPERLLTLGDFTAEVGNPCSGAEGMGLLAVLAAAYLFKFRHALAFPRALVVLPLALLLGFAGNVVRIAVLMWIGDAISPEVAERGFHSKAGWVITCGIAIGVLTWVRRSRWIARDARPLAAAPDHQQENPTALYLMPLLVTLGLSLVTGLFSAGFDALFPLRVIGTALALWFCRRALAGAFGRPALSPLAVLVGAAAFGGWWLIAGRAAPAELATLQGGLAEMGPVTRTIWLVTRVVGAMVTVPLAEELAFRSYLLRRLLRDDFWELDHAQAARRSGAVIASSLLFGALHSGSFIAGTVVGIVYALLLRRRGRLGDAVVAHAVTNALLVVYTLITGDWSFMA